MEQKSNITLIGMPGAGKSTAGIVLAKVLGYRFIDSDLEIQETYGALLHELIQRYGNEKFLEMENRVNAAVSPQRSVIATGGSAVYGKEAMEHFRDISVVVYLRLTYENLILRLGDLKERGVIMKPGQTLQDIIKERQPLYEHYAHVTIDADGLDIRGIVETIVNEVKEAVS